MASRLGQDVEADRHFRDFARRIPVEFRSPIDAGDTDADVVP